MPLPAFLRSLFGRRSSAITSPAPRPAVPRTGFPFVPVGDGALSVAAAYRCVRLLSESVASMPVRCLRLRDGIFVEDEASPLHYLLRVEPNPATSAFDFWSGAVQQILLDGNAYILPLHDGGSAEITRLVLCSPHTVDHDVQADTYTVQDAKQGVSGVYDEREVIHLRGLSLDGKTGVGVLTHARLALDTARAGDAETLQRFANGGDVRGIVSGANAVMGVGEMQDNELRRLASNLDDRFRAGERILNMPGQTEFKQISLSSADMQFLESRRFTVRDICRFFGVHPSFVFDDTSNNYKSAEMANAAFLSNTLNPLLRRIEVELLRKLTPRSLCCKRRFEFDRRALHAADLDSRLRYQQAMIQSGLRTVNELRREENRPPVAGGDAALVSANLRPVSEPASPSAPDDTAGDTPAPTVKQLQTPNTTPQ